MITSKPVSAGNACPRSLPSLGSPAVEPESAAATAASFARNPTELSQEGSQLVTRTTRLASSQSAMEESDPAGLSGLTISIPCTRDTHGAQTITGTRCTPPATCRGRRPGEWCLPSGLRRGASSCPARLRASPRGVCPTVCAPQCAAGTGDSAKDSWGLAEGRARLEVLSAVFGSEGGVPAFRKGLTLGRAAPGTFSLGSSAVFPGEAPAGPLQGQSGFVSVEPPLTEQADSSP